MILVIIKGELTNVSAVVRGGGRDKVFNEIHLNVITDAFKDLIESVEKVHIGIERELMK